MIVAISFGTGQANAKQCSDCDEDSGYPPPRPPEVCVAADTLVSLESGKQVAIQEMNAGDKVITADSITAVIEVTKSKLDKKMYELIDSNNNKLLATENHPIFTKEKGYIKMSDVQVGYTLRTIKGESKVTSNKVVEYNGDTVFNLKVGKEVAKDNFYASNILVGGVYQQESFK